MHASSWWFSSASYKSTAEKFWISLLCWETNGIDAAYPLEPGAEPCTRNFRQHCGRRKKEMQTAEDASSVIGDGYNCKIYNEEGGQLELQIPQHTLLRSGYPHESLVKINCDAAFKDSTAAYGIVVRDSVGTLVRVSGKSCFATSPLHDEVIAIHYACYLAYNQGWCGAIVESDSQTTISLSSSEAVPPWSLGVLIDDIRTWSKSLHLTFSWVNRVNNQVAH
ncbi:reverse transcriptase [Tanacetum coccineum]